MKIQTIGNPGRYFYDAGIGESYTFDAGINGDAFEAGIGGKLRDDWRKVRDKVADVVDKAKDVVNKVTDTGAFKAGAKIGFAAARIAFLALTRLNVRWLASKLAKLNAIKPDQVRKFWEDFGGDYDKLVDAINAGKDKKGIGETSDQVANFAGIGEPTTIAASLIAAAPLIIKIIMLFRQNNLSDADDAAMLQATASGLDNSGAPTTTVTPNPTDQPGTTPGNTPTSTGSGDGLFSTLSSLPTPVKVGGGLLIAYGIYKAIK